MVRKYFVVLFAICFALMSGVGFAAKVELDVDGDGKIDAGFIPTITSYGPTTVQSVSCVDTLTITPTAGLGVVNISVTKEGPGTCTVTMAETGAVEGTIANISLIAYVSIDNTLTFANQSGVLRLISGTPNVTRIHETLSLQYKNSEWVEIGKSRVQIQHLVMPVPTELTIATGVITITQSVHTVDTEGDAASDDLVTINTALGAHLLYLRAAHTDRTIVIKETGNITISNGSQITLSDTSRWIKFIWDQGTSKWVTDDIPDTLTISEVSGSAGSLKSPATTGVLTGTGAAAGATRNMTYPDADFTVNYKSGAYTDGHIIGADGTTGALKDLGAKTTDNSTNDHILAKISGAVENATIVKTIYLPVAYFEDGAAPPAAAAVLASTRKVKTRAFDGASNENLEVSFTVPVDYSSGIKFRFIGYVPGATAPANTEVVAFSFAGCSVANSEVLGCTAGDPQTSSLTADANYVQYDRIAGAWSSAITVTGIAAGETVQGILIRLAESTDTYAQDFALAGIEIKYVATFIMGSAY